jgi:hypothetical protein
MPTNEQQRINALEDKLKKIEEQQRYWDDVKRAAGILGLLAVLAVACFLTGYFSGGGG